MQRTHHRPSRLRLYVATVGALIGCAPLTAELQQTQQDEYAIYDLLDPSTSTFRTIYEVAVTTPGATTFFDRVGDGLMPVPSRDDSVVDLMTGAPLGFELVGGAEARAGGLGGAEQKSQYLRVHLARAVPPDGGQARIRIIKSYKDAKSYHPEGGGLVLDRPIGIRHVAIVLPAGYRITECNIASQVIAEPDGRLRLSFIYQAPGRAALIMKARRGASTGD